MVGWLKKHRAVLICAGLVALTVAVYGQVGRHEFIHLDDGEYVTANEHVQKGLTASNIVWALTTGDVSNWHPLTWLSLMLDYELFGQNRGAFHLVNLALHIAATLLLFGALRYMTGSDWASAFVAALFAIHPMHVESVAWVSERKDVLSGVFWMAAMWTWAWYVRRRGIGRYSVCLLLVTLGLMAKPMLVTLPFVLLLLDYWPLERLDTGRGRPGWHQMRGRKNRRMTPAALVFEKVPFFAVSAASCVITYIVQRLSGAVTPLHTLTIEFRAGNAVISYLRYITKMFVPRGMGIFYPPFARLPAGWLIAAVVVLVGISYFVWRLRNRYKYLAVGWLWYLGTLVPVIGLVQVGAQSMADRYTYIPYIGLFIMLAWGAKQLLAARPGTKPALITVAVTTVAALSVATWVQAGYWRNSLKLFSHTLKVTSDNIIAHECLGHALYQKERYDEAIEQYRKALAIKPANARVQYSMGLTLLAQDRIDEAIEHYQKAIESERDHVKAHYYLANALVKQDRHREAVSYYRKVLNMEPDHSEACNNLALSLVELGDIDGATGYYRRALALNPDSAEVYNNLGNALTKKGDLQAAVGCYQKAIELKDNFAEGYFNLADALRNAGAAEQAVSYYRRGLQIKPDSADPHNGLGLALAQVGRFEEAVEHYQRAIELKNDFSRARYNLGVALFRMDRLDEAIEQFRRVLKIYPEDAEMHCNLATLLARQGLTDEAINHFRLALQYDPNLDRAQKGLRNLLGRSGPEAGGR